MEECAAFIKVFAQQCIDEGADVVVCHGPHFTLGIQLYNKKPIFYGMGLFIFQNETVRFLPSQSYSQFGLDHNATPADLLDNRNDGDTKGFPTHPLCWESFCAMCEFASGKLKQILLYPVDLGYGYPRSQRGRPLLADEAKGEKIIARLTRLSKDLSTQVAYKDGCGIIQNI